MTVLRFIITLIAGYYILYFPTYGFWDEAVQIVVLVGWLIVMISLMPPSFIPPFDKPKNKKRDTQEQQKVQ